MSERHPQRITSEAQDLRDRITASGMTFAEFGRRMGITRNQLYKLLTVQKPSIKLQQQIDHVLSNRGMRH